MTVRLTPLSLDDGMPMDAWQRARKLQLLGGERFVDPVVGSGLAAPRDDMPIKDWQTARNVQVRNGGSEAIHPSTPSPRPYDLVGGASDPPAQMVLAKARSTPMSAGQWEVESARTAGGQSAFESTTARTPSLTDRIGAGVTAAENWFHGPKAELPTGDNAAARWAVAQVGKGGYSKLSPDGDGRGRTNEILSLIGRRGVWDPKCNQFVYDALSAGGAPPGRLDEDRIPLAKDWGDPGAKIAGYQPIHDQPRPGDVVSDGHHVGIYAPLANGRPGTVSAASAMSAAGGPLGRVVHNDWAFRGDEGNIVVWRSTQPPSARNR